MSKTIKIYASACSVSGSIVREACTFAFDIPAEYKCRRVLSASFHAYCRSTEKNRASVPIFYSVLGTATSVLDEWRWESVIAAEGSFALDQIRQFAITPGVKPEIYSVGSEYAPYMELQLSDPVRPEDGGRYYVQPDPANCALPMTVRARWKALGNSHELTSPIVIASVSLAIDGTTVATEQKNKEYPATTLNDEVITVPGNKLTTGEHSFDFYITDSIGQYKLTSGSLSVISSALSSPSPQAGSFVDRFHDALFSVAAVDGTNSLSFRWRKQGDDSYQSLGTSTPDINLAANTLPDGGAYEYQWYGKDRYGASYATEWVPITTVDLKPSCRAVSPDGTMIDAQQTNSFVWEHNVPTGSAQSKAEIQMSQDAASWGQTYTVNGAEQQLQIAANMLTPGTWYWRARSYNADRIASDWSAANQFLVVGAPSTPSIQIVEASPRPLIGWQTDEQAAYEITLDGEVFTSHGAEKRWKSPYYLADGQHSVSIRVQNTYGRWSALSTLSFSVCNNTGEAITLDVDVDHVAELSWDNPGYSSFEVLRDGEVIARTDVSSYVDYLAIGPTAYQIRGCYADSDDYGISSLVLVTATPSVPVLVDLGRGDILPLALSDEQYRTFSWRRKRQTERYHLSGSALPSEDLSEFVDETLTGAVSFDDPAEQRAFEGMFGRLVALKTDTGEQSVGILDAQNKISGIFYATYQISVTNTAAAQADGTIIPSPDEIRTFSASEIYAIVKEAFA